MEPPTDTSTDPMDSLPESTMPALRKISHGWIRVLLALGAFCLIGYHLGDLGLFETSEGRFGSISRTMLDSGDWITPRLNGIPHFSKPPLTYWFSAIGMKLFGISEGGAKAFLPVTAALTVLGCYQIGLILLNARAALCASFVLLSSALFLFLSRGLTSDPLLAMFETWMVWALISFVQTSERCYSVLFWILAGFAMLTKGPPGLLPLLGLFPALWRLGYKNGIRALMREKAGWACFLTIGFGWFIFVTLKNEGLIHYFLVRETLDRVASDVHSRTQPWYFFFGVLLAGTFPWTSFFVETLWDEVRRVRKEPKFSRLVLLAWLIVPFIVFSCSHSKLATYILPLMVPCALIVGEFLARKLHFAEDEPFTYQMGAAITIIIFAVLGLFLIYFSLAGFIPNQLLGKLAVFIALHFIFLAIFGYAFMFLKFGKGVIMVLGVAVPGMIFFILPYLEGHEEYYQGRFLHGVRPLLTKVAQLPKEATIVCVGDMLESIPFYVGRAIPTWEVAREKKFDSDAVLFFDLHGAQALRELASGTLFLLAREKDVGNTQQVIQKTLKLRDKCGNWGLYAIGEPMPPAIREGTVSGDISLPQPEESTSSRSTPISSKTEIVLSASESLSFPPPKASDGYDGGNRPHAELNAIVSSFSAPSLATKPESPNGGNFSSIASPDRMLGGGVSPQNAADGVWLSLKTIAPVPSGQTSLQILPGKPIFSASATKPVPRKSVSTPLTR